MNLANTFRNWGIPTAHSLAVCSDSHPDFPFIGTGDKRWSYGCTAVSLGAKFVGIGLPLLRAAMKDEKAVMDKMAEYVKGLESTMVATNSRKLLI